MTYVPLGFSFPEDGPARRILRAGPMLLALAGAILSGTAGAQESFFEDFEALDRGRWYVSDGWTNGPHQNCLWSSRAVSVSDGRLVLSLRPTGEAETPLLCGEVQTNDRYLHGTFEARIRTDRASGVNAAFFTYIGEVHDRPHDEIDVEILTRDPGRVEFNTFVDGEMRNGGAVALDRPADAAFHHYAFVWDEERVRWFVDGDLVHEAPSDGMTDAQKIYLSHWSSDLLTEWMGRFEMPEAPLRMHVDWIAWTAPGDGCQFPRSILCDEAAE
ncbi:MAG: family 16 glycosylhydrolase [Roseicyclus sp.]